MRSLCVRIVKGSVEGCFVTHSISFMPLIAASASSSFEKRTKPKPRLRPVSRSLTTTWEFRVSIGEISVDLNARRSYSFLDDAKLLEL